LLRKLSALFLQVFVSAFLSLVAAGLLVAAALVAAALLVAALLVASPPSRLSFSAHPDINVWSYPSLT
jgi:hypothetical protein